MALEPDAENPVQSKPTISWFRPEPFGAWVRLDDRTLIAVDHALAQRLGISFDKTAVASTGPLEAHVSLTSRCYAPCTDCYLDAKPDGVMPSFEALQSRILAWQKLGASTIAFGGGEPLLRDDLGRLATIARSLGLVPVMTTSGFGLTEQLAAELRAFAQINVSHDGVNGGYGSVRGFDGSRAAERAIEMLVHQGIPVGANVVVTRDSFPHLLETAEHLAGLGVGELQLLRFKPRGRAARADYLDKRLTSEQVLALWTVIKSIVDRRRMSVRIDCALVPLLSEALVCLDEPAQVLAALGVFGCEAGRHLGAVDAHGRSMACSFSEGSAAGEQDLASAWSADPELERFRGYHANPDEPCRSCVLRSVCRGGCQIVSRYAFGAFGPDPECPRVMRRRRHLEVLA